MLDHLVRTVYQAKKVHQCPKYQNTKILKSVTCFACPEILRSLRREYFCTFFSGLEEENWRMGEEVGREGEGRLLLGPVTPTIQYGFPIPTNPYLYNDNESLQRVAQWIQFSKENSTSNYIWPAHMKLLFQFQKFKSLPFLGDNMKFFYVMYIYLLTD